MIDHFAYSSAERQRREQRERELRAAHIRFLTANGAPTARIELLRAQLGTSAHAEPLAPIGQGA